MMRMPPRERPRRGAWRGSRPARAGASTCLAAVIVALAVPGPAAAYRCGSTQPPDGAQARAMFRDCRAEAPPERRPRANKRGSMSSLTVLVVAVAAALADRRARDAVQPRRLQPGPSVLEEGEDELSELLRRPPLNHVVGLLDYSATRARDLPGEQLTELVDRRDIPRGRDDERGRPNLTEPAGRRRVLGGIVRVRRLGVLDEHRA